MRCEGLASFRHHKGADSRGAVRWKHGVVACQGFSRRRCVRVWRQRPPPSRFPPSRLGSRHLSQVDESVRLLQDSEISPVASRLLARVLERSILTGEAAATAMAAIAPTIPPGLEKNMLEFALSDARIAEFLQIADAVPDVVDDSYPAYMPLRMQVKCAWCCA